MSATQVRLCLLFVALLLVTRSTHAAYAFALPDATLPLLLLGGFWIRRWLGFVSLMAAAFVADWIAIGTLAVPDFCFSPAYAGLVPTYLVVWLAGWWLHSRRPHASVLAWLATAVVATTAAFAISNVFWYAFSGRFEVWSVANVASSVLHYYPAYLATTLGYLALAWLIRAAVQRVPRNRVTHSAA